MRAYGAQSMVDRLTRVAVRRPDRSFSEADPAIWHYTDRPDAAAAAAEHDALVALLEDDGIEVLRHDSPLPGLADAIYVHDPVLVVESGTIELRMGKSLRRGEEESLAGALERNGVPRAGKLTAPAIAEAGDLLWVDSSTLAIGIGFRTNAAAVGQLSRLLPGVELLPFHLPYAGGPAACLHLMSLVSLVDHDVAVVHRPLLPVPLWQLLSDRGYRYVDVPPQELVTHGTNVLATAPGDCIMLEGNPITQAALEDAGCKVRTYRGSEITLKAEGGATCLTRPVSRG